MKCPNCGFEPDSAKSNLLAPQEYYSRQLAQMQNMNQLSGYGMQNNTMYGGGRLGSMQYGSPGIDYAAEELPKPEPKPTAWGQFKAMIREMIP